ncbi:MAG: lipid-A-disaccharide synthase [Bacteroidota bacterium]|nr:lipid-A-disaccharide synthase [Bacteroidota bacterium]
MIQRVMMIAGETSGDVHGAGVVRELKRRQSSIEIFGIGGDKMQQEGMVLTYHVRELSFMGFWEVVKHLPLIRSVERTMEQLLKLKKPDVVVLIDYPGFNLRFAQIIKRYGIKIAYYISPQVWAWQRGRIKKMKDVVDKMLVVFPFEVGFYDKGNIPVEFVGHPLLEEMNVEWTREQFCKRYALDPSKKMLALIPGSRKQEIVNIFSVMARAAEELSRKLSGRLEVVVAVAPHLSLEIYRDYVPEGSEVHFVEGATHEVMKFSDAAIVTSGTATLETACFGTPMVVVYRTSWLTYLIGRLVVRIKNISLVNIVAAKTVVPELIQHRITVPRIVTLISKLLDDENTRAAMRTELLAVREKLGAVGASARVADAILAMS